VISPGVIALAGITGTLLASIVPLLIQRRSSTLQYRRESYRDAITGFVVAVEKAQYRIVEQPGTEPPDALLESVELSRVGIDIYGSEHMRRQAHAAYLAMKELAELPASGEEYKAARQRLHYARAKLIEAARSELSPRPD
jgi:hypothetical protein